MNSIRSIDEIIHDYETVVKIVDTEANDQKERASGGVIRAVKGKLQEHITEEIVKLAWKNLYGESSRLLINRKKYLFQFKSHI